MVDTRGKRKSGARKTPEAKKSRKASQKKKIKVKNEAVAVAIDSSKHEKGIQVLERALAERFKGNVTLKMLSDISSSKKHCVLFLRYVEADDKAINGKVICLLCLRYDEQDGKYKDSHHKDVGKQCLKNLDRSNVASVMRTHFTSKSKSKQANHQFEQLYEENNKAELKVQFEKAVKHCKEHFNINISGADYEAIKNKKRKEDEPSASSNIVSLLNESATDVVPANRNEYRNNLIAWWLVLSGRESTVVEDELLTEIFHNFDPSFELMSRGTEVRRETTIYAVAFYHMKETFAKCAAWYNEMPYLSLEGDGWSSQSNKAVFVLSVKYYDPFINKNVCHTLDSCPIIGGKAAVDLQRMIERTLSRFGIEKKHVLQTVSDCEGSVQNAFKAAFDSRDIHVSCMIRVLQTVIRHAFGFNSCVFKKDGFKMGFDFYTRIKRLISYFKKSYKRENELSDVAKKNQNFDLKLIRINTTRWSSAFKGLERLLVLKKSLGIFFVNLGNDDKAKSVKLTDDEWLSVKEIVGMLQLPAVYTTLMQHDKHPMAAYRYILVKRLLFTARQTENLQKVVYKGADKKSETVVIKTELGKECSKRYLRILFEHLSSLRGVKEYGTQTLEEFFPNKEKPHSMCFSPKRNECIPLYLDARTRNYFMLVKVNASTHRREIVESEVKAWIKNILKGDDKKDTPPPVVENTSSEAKSTEGSKRTSLSSSSGSGEDATQDTVDLVDNDLLLDPDMDMELEPNQNVNEKEYVEYLLDAFMKEFNEDIYLHNRHSSKPLGFLAEKYISKESYNPITILRKSEANETNKELKYLLRRAIAEISMPLSSSFSERLVSYAQRISSGRRSNCGYDRLRKRLFIKFNHEGCEKTIREKLCLSKSELSTLVMNLKEEEKNQFVSDTTEEVVASDEEDSSSEDDSQEDGIAVNWTNYTCLICFKANTLTEITCSEEYSEIWACDSCKTLFKKEDHITTCKACWKLGLCDRCKPNNST